MNKLDCAPQNNINEPWININSVSIDGASSSSYVPIVPPTGNILLLDNTNFLLLDGTLFLLL